MKNKTSEKTMPFIQDNKNQKVLPKKSSTKSNGQIVTHYNINKNEQKYNKYNVIIESAKSKINDILEDKNIPEHYKKDFIDIDIKLKEQPKEDERSNKKTLIDSKNTNKSQRCEVDIHSYINSLTKIFSECQNKLRIYKNQLENLISNENGEKHNINKDSNSQINSKKNNTDTEINDFENVKDNISKISMANKNVKTNKEGKKSIFNKYEIELNELKSEIYLFKMRYEIYKAKSLFYENIFNTVKNAIDNFSFEVNSKNNSNYNNNDLSSNLNKAFGNFTSENQKNKSDLNTISHTLKEKLNLILTQNNKYYYQEFQDKFNCFEYRNYNFCNKDWNFDSDLKSKNSDNEKYLKNLDKNLSEIAITINNFLKEADKDSDGVLNDNISYSNYEINQANNTLSNLKSKLFMCLKNLISVYLTGENLNLEIRAKNNFILERENEFLLFEQAERKSKILKELLSIIQPNLNKVINNKFKNEMVDKLSNIINFYENFNLILKNENTMLKNQLNKISQIKDFKINSLGKIIDQFLIFSEPTIIKIKELTDISSSANLKNKDKLLSAFMNVEYTNFYDLIDKYYDMKNKNSLIK